MTPAQARRGSGPPRAAPRGAGAGRAASVVVPQHGLSRHGISEAVPNLLRALVGDFLRAPRAAPALDALGADARLCQATSGPPAAGAAGPAQLRCQELGPEPLVPLDATVDCSSWSAEYHAQYYGAGQHEACAV